MSQSALELRGRIRKVFDYVRDTVLVGNEPRFRVLDTKEVAGGFFDTSQHCLSIEAAWFDKSRHRDIKLVSNSFTFERILTMLNFLDQHLASRHNQQVNFKNQITSSGTNERIN